MSTKRTELNLLKSNRISRVTADSWSYKKQLGCSLISFQCSSPKTKFWSFFGQSLNCPRLVTASSFQHYTCFLKNLRSANRDKLSKLIGKYENPIILKPNLLRNNDISLRRTQFFGYREMDKSM